MKCVGCGESSESHPFVGIGKEVDGRSWWQKLYKSAPNDELQAFPVCARCWLDPEHRQHALKMHFFPAANGSSALVAARVLDERSKRGEDLSL